MNHIRYICTCMFKEAIAGTTNKKYTTKKYVPKTT